MIDSSVVENGKDDKNNDNDDEIYNLRETVYQPEYSNRDKESVFEVHKKNNENNNLDLSVNNRKPYDQIVETGDLNLIKSDRNLEKNKKNDFKSDRLLEPVEDKSYKLIQNKNGKELN